MSAEQMAAGESRGNGEQDRINIALCAAGELFGGVEQFIYSFALHLRKKNVHAIVLLFSRGALYDKLKAENIETYLYTAHKYNPRVVGKIAALLKAKKISIVHTHGYKTTILCGIAAKLSGIKVVKTEHGMREPSRSLLHGAKMGLNYVLDKVATLSLVDSMAFVSRDIEDHYKTLYGGKKRYMIHNAIPAIRLKGSETPEDVDDRAFNIGIIGRLGEVKGHRYLLKAMKKLLDIPDIRLNIFGDGPLREDILRWCRENSLTERVRCLGFKSNIHAYMNALDLLVMPSLHEGLPYTLLEAMYLQVPIIASRVGGLQEILEHNVDALLVPPADDEPLAGAIRYLYFHPEVRAEMAGNAFRKVTAKFMIEHMTDRYIQVYQKCLVPETKPTPGGFRKQGTRTGAACERR